MEDELETVPFDTIEGIKLLECLGQGGMGVVYKGMIERDRTLVAIKIMYPSLSLRPVLVARFLQEGAILANMSQQGGHPNIVRYFKHGEVTIDGRKYLYLVMEYLEGSSLEKRLEHGRPNAKHAVEVARQICCALVAAHAESVIHRDIKPANIFLARKTGTRGLVKVLDFGISHLASEQRQKLTETGHVLGTPRYMAPEQLMSSKAPDERVDVYAICAVLYRMCAEDDAFPEDNPVLAMMLRMKGPPARPQNIDDKLWDIIKCGLAQEPSERIQSVLGLLGALNDYAKTTNAPPLPSTLPLEHPPMGASGLTVAIPPPPRDMEANVRRQTPHAKGTRRNKAMMFIFAVMPIIITMTAYLYNANEQPRAERTVSPIVTVPTPLSPTPIVIDGGVPPDASVPRTTTPHRTHSPPLPRRNEVYTFPPLSEWRRCSRRGRERVCNILCTQGFRGTGIAQYCPTLTPARRPPITWSPSFGGMDEIHY